MRYGLEQFQKFGKAEVGHATLFAEVVMVGRDELAERHVTLRAVLQQVNDLQGKLLGSLHLVSCLVFCRFKREKRDSFRVCMIPNSQISQCNKRNVAKT